MSILNIAYSSLNAFQRALEVTGNNIANASTRGYSRQTINFTSTVSHSSAGGYMGSGVTVSSINRNADDFASAQLRTSLSTRSQYEAFYEQAIQIDKLLAQDGSSISGSLQTFFNALGQLNSNPGSISERNIALKQSQLLAQQFQSLQTKLDEYQQSSTEQIGQVVNQINLLTTNLADVNLQLMGNSDSPELLDQKDELLRELSKYSDLTIYTQDNGMVTVSLASGEMLVSGTEKRDLVVTSAQGGALGTNISINNGSGLIDLTDRFSSGTLGGLLDYEKNVLGRSSQLIGQLAIGLAQTFNAQHKLGMDLNDQIGKDYFTDFNSANLQLNRAFSSSSNTGSGVLSVEIADISQVELSDYELIVSDAASNQVRLIRKSDGTSTTLNWSNTPPAPPAGQFNIDGMIIKVDDLSKLANNDSFTISPTRRAAQDLAVQITNSSEIALASPVMTSSALTNTGQGLISLGSVFNTDSVAKQYRIEFVSDTQYNLVNVSDSTSSGPFTMVPNSNNTIQIPDGTNPSYSIVLSGIPKAGDQFTTQYNAGASGDNRNGLSLSAISQSKIFSGGGESIFDGYANLLSDVGAQTNQAKQRYDSSDVLYRQAVDYRDSKSGVNLDEEGANLLKFKQAYEAAGKLMEVSNQIMGILFNMMR